MSKPKVVTEFVYPPIPIRDMDWSAHDSDSYDGAPDSGRRAHIIGWGKTEADAIAEFWEKWNEMDEEDEL